MPVGFESVTVTMLVRCHNVTTMLGSSLVAGSKSHIYVNSV